MLNKQEILKMVAHVAKRGNSIRDKQLINPEREWAIAVTASLLFLVIIFYVNGARFTYYKNIELNLPPSDSTVAKYRYGNLQEVLRFYDEREKTFKEMSNGVTPIETPSIAPDNATSSGVISGEVISI